MYNGWYRTPWMRTVSWFLKKINTKFICAIFYQFNITSKMLSDISFFVGLYWWFLRIVLHYANNVFWCSHHYCSHNLPWKYQQLIWQCSFLNCSGMCAFRSFTMFFFSSHFCLSFLSMWSCTKCECLKELNCYMWNW